jgi:hypothetical protein
MAGLEPGQARITHPDPDVQDAIVGAASVPHWEYQGWKLAEGDRETWPAELQRFEGQAQVRIRHPETGGEATVGADSVPHWRSRGWQVVDEADYPADLETKTVAELRELAKKRGISPVPTTKADLVEALEDQRLIQRLQPLPSTETDDDQAGVQPAQPEEE